MKYTDRQRIEKIIFTAERLSEYLSTNEVTPEKVMSDYAIQWTVTTPLYNIGEQTYNLSVELKDRFPEIPWMKISGMRHRLVHDYEGTNWSIIIDVLFRELPIFIGQLREILKVS